MFPPTDNVDLRPFAPLPIANRPWKEAASNCPRCDSPNTKFCYYNNYSLTQPRYFCKSCRRYWTNGGSLRNVLVGGGCRKNGQTKSSSSAATSTVSPPPISFRRPDPLINDASVSASAGGIDLEALYGKHTNQHSPDLDPLASEAAKSSESSSGNCQIDAQIDQPPADNDSGGGLLAQAQFEPNLDVEFVSLRRNSN